MLPKSPNYVTPIKCLIQNKGCRVIGLDCHLRVISTSEFVFSDRAPVNFDFQALIA